MLDLRSSEFEDGAAIPERFHHREDGHDVNPPLDVECDLDGVASFALVMTDVDTAYVEGTDHWVVWNLPADTTHVESDWDPDEAVEGENDLGDQGYHGPDPDEGTHTYQFTLYALDTTFDLSPSASGHDVRQAARGHHQEITAGHFEHGAESHVLAEATLEGVVVG